MDQRFRMARGISGWARGEPHASAGLQPSNQLALQRGRSDRDPRTIVIPDKPPPGPVKGRPEDRLRGADPGSMAKQVSVFDMDPGSAAQSLPRTPIRGALSGVTVEAGADFRASAPADQDV